MQEEQHPPQTPQAEPPEYFENPPEPVQRKRMSRRGMFIGGVIAVLAVAGLGWLAWSLTQPAETGTAQAGPGGARRAGMGPGGRGGPATTVGIAVAETAEIPVILDALGTVVPQATVRVRPQVSGVLQRVLFKEGQMVAKGALLAQIDPRPFEAALQQAMGARQRDEAQLQAARVTLQRYQTLWQQDSIARQEVDTQAATVRQLEASIVSDRAAEATARLNLAYTRIVAPIGGRVGLRPVDVGNVVGPSDTNGVALITQLNPIDVEFAVPQDHASWLQHNAGAFMEVRVFDRTRTTLLDTGVFASLDNQIDTQTGTVRAKARFNNERRQLFPSQFVNVKLQLRTIKDAVVVPVAAVRQGGTGDHVFVLMDDRTVQLRPVVRGQPVGDKVQIASGLRIGEKVVTEGADRLRDGSRVVLPGDAPARPGGPASQPFTGASAAQAPASATPPWAPASALMGAGRGETLTPEEREARRQRLASMTPEERAALREQRRQRRPAAGASAPAASTQ